MASVFVGDSHVEYSVVTGKPRYLRLDGREYDPESSDEVLAAWVKANRFDKDEGEGFYKFVIRLMEKGFL